jgi:two-component system response regulator NreC
MSSTQIAGPFEEDAPEGVPAVRVVAFGWEQMSLQGICASLAATSSIEVAATASAPEDLMRYASGHRPDVVLLISWPHDPVELTSSVVTGLRDASPESRVVVLGRETDARVVRETLRAGANGYVLVMEGTAPLVEAIELASQNYAYLSHRMGCEIARVPDAGPDDPTEREEQVIGLLAEGFTNAETAERLSLSVRTVESHRSAIYQKLGFVARHELVAYALERRLLLLSTR